MLLNILNLIALQTAPAAPAAESAAKISQEVAELKSLSLEDLINRLAQSAVTFAINLAIAIVVFYVGRFIIRKIGERLRGSCRRWSFLLPCWQVGDGPIRRSESIWGFPLILSSITLRISFAS